MSSSKNNTASSQQAKENSNASADIQQTVSTTTFLEHIYPGKGQRNLKRILRKTDIPTFQRTHSLHSMYAHAFQTTPSHLAKRETTRAAKKIKMQEQKKGMIQEPFQPESVLLFLSHLGVTTTEVHVKIAEALRSKLDDEIDRMRLSKASNFEALRHLLIQCWDARDVPELRPVLVAVIKKLGDKTPPQLLQRLADKEDGGKLKYEELLAQFGLPMRRLVWEADWDKVCAARLDENSSASTDPPSSLMSDMIQAHIKRYCNDEELSRIAEIPFVGTISDRRLMTQKRRSKTYVATNAISTHNIMGKKEDKTTSEKKMSAAVDAVSQIKEVIGDRPKILAAVFHILIEMHGKNADKLEFSSDGNILGGKDYLTCTLVSDVILSHGHLPKHYEFLGILATVLDETVRLGVLSDDALAQIQGCLRIIFAPPAAPVESKNGEKGGKLSLSTSSITASSTTSTQRKKYSLKDDKKYVSSLLNEVISSAITAMKTSDTKMVFLNPVTDAIAPGYSNVISKPMCILTISQKANSNQYNSLTELEKDVDLMFQNCINYNVGDAGAWFRGEAKRQKKICKDSILPQAKNFFKVELTKRKADLEKEYAILIRDEKKKKKEGEKKNKDKLAELAKLKKTSLVFPESSQFNRRGKDVAITSLTGNDVSPLPSSKMKKRKREPNANPEAFDLPSIPTLATMMLSDPFVVRLICEKLFRTVRVQVLAEKSVFLPSCHTMIPSLFQLLHIAQLSTQICVTKGKCTIPDSGLKESSPTSPNHQESKNTPLPQFFFLRKYVPRYGKLILSVYLDQRTSVGGDLHGAMQGGSLPPIPITSADDWKHSSNLRSLLVLTEYAFVYLFFASKPNESVLKVQLSRLTIVLHELSGGDMRLEKTFFRSLASVLGSKRKLRSEVRDLIVEIWFGWFQCDGADCMCSPVHEVFVYLLNEWAALGNLVLPRDTLLSLSIATVEKSEESFVSEENSNRFANAWFLNSSEFLPVKIQYERMLSSVGETHAEEWKNQIHIDEASFEAWKEENSMHD